MDDYLNKLNSLTNPELMELGRVTLLPLLAPQHTTPSRKKASDFLNGPLCKSLLARQYSEHLDMSDGQFASFDQAINQSQGLIILAGVIQSGMNTHIYSALVTLAKLGKKVITIEVEPRLDLPGIDQIQCRFGELAQRLVSVAKSNVDVIYLRELTSLEDFEAVLIALASKKLIFTTMHCANVVAVLKRLRILAEQLITREFPSILANGLRLIQVQRKMGRLCNDCRRSHALNKDDMLALGIDSPHYYSPGQCNSCAEELVSGYCGHSYLYEQLSINAYNRQQLETLLGLDYESEKWNKPPLELVDNLSLSDSAKQSTQQGRISLADSFRICPIGNSASKNYPDRFLSFLLKQPIANISAQVFSIYIHEFVPFPRLHLETYLDDDCLSLKEIILSSNGYYVINSCKPINELEVVFTTTRGQLNESNSKNALFEKMLDFEEKSQLLQTLDGSIMKWWLYAEHYSGHLDKTSNEFAERQFIKPPVYPAMNVCYQPYVGEYAYAVDIASQDMLQKLSLDLVKEFDALATSAKNESASQVISNTICDHWRDFRARRFRRLNHSGLINLPYICDSDRGLFE